MNDGNLNLFLLENKKDELKSAQLHFQNSLYLFTTSLYSFWSNFLAGDSGDIDEDTAKELEHTYLQNTMDKELNELNRRLEQKEVLRILESTSNL